MRPAGAPDRLPDHNNQIDQPLARDEAAAAADEARKPPAPAAGPAPDGRGR